MADERIALLGRHRALRTLIADLREELAAVTDARGAGSDDEHDPEGSTVGYERARLSSLLERAESSLRAIELAIELGASDALQVCQRCGSDIDPERSAALLGVRTCRACALAGAASKRWP